MFIPTKVVSPPDEVPVLKLTEIAEARVINPEPL